MKAALSKILPTIGWVDLSPEDAMELELEQAGRFRWQAFVVGWLGHGVTIWVRAK